MEERNHQRKVQLFFTITLTLLEHQLLNLKQKCSPAALAADPRTDVEAMFSRIANAIKVNANPGISISSPLATVLTLEPMMRTCSFVIPMSR